MSGLRRWHKTLGLSAAVFVFILALTGLALNHTEQLALDQQHVQSDLILDWYEIGVAQVTSAYRSGSHWALLLDSQIYFDGEPLPGHFQQLKGLVSGADWLVVAADESLFLLTPAGEFIEQLTAEHGLPADIQRIGLHGNQLAMDTAGGLYLSDSQLLGWDLATSSDVVWSSAMQAPAQIASAAIDHARSHTLPMERVVLDLHSGRFFGSYGVYVMDAAAIILLLLAASGVVRWMMSRK